MADTTRFRRGVGLTTLAGLSLAICLALQSVAGADMPGWRYGNCPANNYPAGACPNCPVNSKYFGYYPTHWGRWPGTVPAPAPAVAPNTETVPVPLVEPPPPMQEIENKTKAASPSDSGTGAAGSPTNILPDRNALKPGDLPPANDPNAKRPNPQGPDQGAGPAASGLPQSRDPVQPNWPRNSAEAIHTTLPARGMEAQAWPPVNILRTPEIRADYQRPNAALPANVETAAAPAGALGQPLPAKMPETSNFRSGDFGTSPAIASGPNSSGQKIAEPKTSTANYSAPTAAAAAMPANSAPANFERAGSSPRVPAASAPGDSEKRAENWHADFGTAAAAPQVPLGNDDFSTASASHSAAPSRGLHWGDAPALKASQNMPGAAAAAPDIQGNIFNSPAAAPALDSRETHATGASADAARDQASRTPFATPESSHSRFANRIPFVPSASLRDPLAPLDPRSLTDRGTPQGITPADFSAVQLAPPSRVTEIAPPMPASDPGNAALPGPKSGQVKVTLIDPLAIGRSLESAQPSHGLEPAESTVLRNASRRIATDASAGAAPARAWGAHSIESASAVSGPNKLSPTARLPYGSPAMAPAATPFATNRVPGEAQISDCKSPIGGALRAPGSSECLATDSSATPLAAGDSARGQVQPASYWGPAARRQSTAGNTNPLRSAAAMRGQALSTDTPSGGWSAASDATGGQAGGPASNTAGHASSGWTNPLRSGN